MPLPCTPELGCRVHVCQHHRALGRMKGPCPDARDECRTYFLCYVHRWSRHATLGCSAGAPCTLASQCAIHKPADVIPCLYE
jgi:hypothetical protein